jgi:thioredoxin reductase (NADPH)
VIRLTPADIRRLLVCASGIGEKWMEALLRRCQILSTYGVEGLRIIGSHSDAATLRLREFFFRNGVMHRWVDTAEASNHELVAALGAGPWEFPLIARRGRVLLQNPSLREVADIVGIHPVIPDQIFDTVIIGCGPSGLGAAVYAASEGLHTLVLDRVGPGGQAGASSRIENYTGFPSGLSGHELAMRSYLQALKFGAIFSVPNDVAAVRCLPGELHQVEMKDGSVVKTKTVIVATGVTYRKLNVKGLSEMRGPGIYYAATQVEALLCDKRPVHVIGAGNSAGQAAMFLSKLNEHVHLVARGGDLRKSMSTYLSERVEANPRIKVRLNTELREVGGDNTLEWIAVENTATGEMVREESCGVFIFIGATPCTDFLGEGFHRDDKGFLITGAELAASGFWPSKDRLPGSLETSCPGVFAAGDCRAFTPKRVAFAVGDGALAVSCVHDFLGTYS